MALCVALEPEARGVVRYLVPIRAPSPQLSLWEGTLEATPVVLVLTGVGKVAAALAAQFVCDAYHPRGAISFGLAGAAQSGGPPGQVIVASGALQHDMDARPLTSARGTVPSFGAAIFPADPTLSRKLRQAAQDVVKDPSRIISGLVLTGDQIITSREVRDGVLRNFPEGRCFDMETAAVAQVANQNGIPWAAVRMTSDAADETFNLDEVLSFGAETASSVFDKILRRLLRDP
jgi:adenosylhomocysteine nucleosidase